MPYREYTPPPHLAAAVECFWTSEITPGSTSPQRILPDACEDVVWIPNPGILCAVGTMTCAQLFAHTPGQTIAGVRFHPSMARDFFGVRGDEMADVSVGLEDLWGARGARLQRRLSGANGPLELVQLLAAALKPVDATPEQRVTLWVAEQKGHVRMDDLARFAGWSQRHLRRIFLEQTGLSPKMFCRVLRFRGLIQSLRPQDTIDWAGYAFEAGYYDQSHLIHEFRELAGLTPAQYALSVFSNRAGAACG